MGIESKKAPPLPAPTETESESVVSSPTELPDDLASEADKTADQESSFSLPDDGTPITIKTRGHHKPNRSQTSLLIEYFETTKTKGPPKQGSSKSNRRPSVRVRLAPSKHHDKGGHIQITETKSSSGKSAMGRRNNDDGPLVQHSLSQLDATDPEDSRSMNSYASATEESNVSRQPIEVDIDPNQYRRKKERKVSSPLIPATDSKASSYVPPNMSDISVIPTDSFLDGETGDREERRSRSPRRSRSRSRAQEPNGVGSVAAAAAAAALDKKNRRPRSESHDRRIIERAVEKASRPESKHRSSKSRRTSVDKGDAESRASARRRSRHGHKDSVVSAADSSVLSSQLSPSHRSYDSHASSKVSINNPKLLETVEDAIRRLILPELSAIKRERSVRETRQPNTKQSLSSLTSVSREELSAANKRKSVDTTQSTKSRGREARNDLSPRSSLDHTSLVESIDDQDDTPRRAKESFENPSLLGPSAAAQDRSRGDDKRQRRRRRAKTPERGRASEEYRETEYEVIPPMPLTSEMNPSEITRTSILSADTDRPHSASEEMTPVREVPRGVASMESIEKAPTPTRTPLQPTLQGLGAQHANISHGDLKALPRQGPGEYDDREYNDSDLSQNYTHEQYDDEYDDDHVEPGMYERGYFQQDVPPPLRYVPYQQERRGLSPIQSVSGYTENESDLHHRRDSRATQSEISSPGKSISSIPSHMRSREFGDDVSDLRSSGYYQDTQYTDGSDVDRVTSGQAVQGVGANPQIIHQPFSTESAVASLVDGSALEPSLLSAGQRDSQISYDSRGLDRLSRGTSPTKKRSLPGDRLSKASRASQEFSEYDLDEYGRKVPRQQNYQHSPSPSEAAIISRGFAKAAAAIAEKEDHSSPAQAEHDDQFVGEGVSRNRSFKERTKNGYHPNTTPRHSIDRLSDYDQPRMGASGLPDSDHPMPEIGWGYDKSNASSVVQDPVEEPHNGEYWQQHTPTQEKTFDFDRAATPKAGDRDGRGMGVEGAAAAGMATAHSRQPSQDQDDEWQRTSMDRKRDTLVTNPYEGTSPIANLPGLEGFGSPGFDPSAYRGGFNTGSPGMHQGDEGYETSAPNDRDMMKGKGVEHQNQPSLGGGNNDPFFAPKHTRQMSGLSQGMDSQFYDASTGNGIDRIESTDIIALMEHLMVRDAQRSARDQELIQTVVQITREMHTSFRDMKRALAESEDQIIGEVQGNTEKTVQRHLGGPRPLPGSASRSLQGYSQTNTLDDLPAKKRGLFRRALKGLNSKGTKDLTRIEDMLMHLLTEVDVLKHQTGGSATLAGLSTHNRSVENFQPEGQYEQDRGYEPEGNAGTSTTSHGSQSGHLSIPQGRGSSGRMGYDRKFSDHRISTVDEGPEDEYDRNHPRVTMADEYSNPDLLMSPAMGPPSRAESVPLATPPPAITQNQQASMSNENTPATDVSKKHKSKGSSGFLPKISRWSETTTSSIGRVFRNSGQSRGTKSDQLDDFFHPPSRSGSNLDQQEQYPKHDPYGDDKLNSGYSEPDLMANSVPMEAATPPVRYHLDEPPQPSTYMTPEDPKYKAHRNSVNLQHPQPRPGQTERFRTALESSAINYDSPMSPKSADWAGSATSLHRFPAQQSNRYDQSPADEYRNAYQSSPSATGPPRPPKEPLDSATPPRNDRVNKLQKKQSPSPLAYQPMDSAYTTSTQVRSDSFRSGSGSPKPENKNLSAALNTPARRPSGPRAMTPSKGFRSPDSDTESIRSTGEQSARDDRRRKRDTFGSVPRPDSAVSQESETF